jgi:hypothetical protein
VEKYVVIPEYEDGIHKHEEVTDGDEKQPVLSCTMWKEALSHYSRHIKLSVN